MKETYNFLQKLSIPPFRKDSLFATIYLFGFFPETWALLLLPFILFALRAAGVKRSPVRRLSIILLVRKLTTLLKSPGSIFP
jgi:hypothetical protein